MASDVIRYLGLVAILIFIMYIIYSLLTYLRNGREDFAGNGNAVYDIAGFLAQRVEYENENKDGTSPPLLIASAVPDIASQLAAAQIQVSTDVQLEFPKFILYTTKPRKQTFELAANYASKTPMENYLDSLARLTVSTDGFSTYRTFITLNYKLYEYKKEYSPSQANILGIVKQDVRSATPIKLYVAVGKTALQYKQLEGEASADLLAPLLRANSQKELDKMIEEVNKSADGRSATPSANGSGMASASASASRSANLQLPLQTYIADAWLANKALFDEMAKSASSSAATAYATAAATSVGTTSDTYINTLRKFIELDKRIIGSDPLKAPNKSFKFKVPNAYDPSLQSLAGDYETPADPGTAVDFKCYSFKQDEVDAISYFSKRTVENATMTNKEIADQVRKNICASYGYYSSSAVGDVGCNCNGCCIPIAYKAKQSGLGIGGQTQQALANTTSDSLEILSKVDNCVRIAQPFQIKRTGPVFRKTPTCGMETNEGFISLPANYGLMNSVPLSQAIILDRLQAAEVHEQLAAHRAAKGRRFFGATGMGAGLVF